MDEVVAPFRMRAGVCDHCCANFTRESGEERLAQEFNSPGGKLAGQDTTEGGCAIANTAGGGCSTHR